MNIRNVINKITIMHQITEAVKILTDEDLEKASRKENPGAWYKYAVEEEMKVRDAEVVSDISVYRLYADGTVVFEDDFREYDNSHPYYDDFGEYFVPDDTITMLKLYERGYIPVEVVEYVLDSEWTEWE
jgi:hypothetical protein